MNISNGFKSHINRKPYQRKIKHDWQGTDFALIQRCMIEQSLEELSDLRTSLENRRDAWIWLMSEDSDHPFSFNNCAKTCGYDADEIRLLVKQQVNADEFKH